jgi:hypothetical protein
MKSEYKFIKKLETFITEGRNIIMKGKYMNDDIDNKIKTNAKIIKEDFSNVVIYYGNWGASPNLKRNAPTPGIGLRRYIHQYFPTVTINEHFTSVTCPCCKQRTLENVELRGEKRKVTEKHHLLRCKNEDCFKKITQFATSKNNTL